MPLADLETKYQPIRKTLTLQLDGTMADRQALARRRVAGARQVAAGVQVSEHLQSLADPNPVDRAAQVADAQAELDRLIEEGKVTEQTFVFAAIGHEEFEELVTQSPPKPEQQAEQYRWDPDVFGPLLVAACLVEPQLTEAEVRVIWHGDPKTGRKAWSPGIVNSLYATAWDVCQSVHGVDPLSQGPSGNGSDGIPSTGPN